MKLDCVGKACPLPVIETKKQIEKMNVGDTLIVSVDNEIATFNLQKLAKKVGLNYNSKKINEKLFEVELTITGDKKGDNSVDFSELDSCDINNNKIVVVNSSVMGNGNDELGKVLIKGFLFAISNLEVLPSKIIFYNGGVKLTTTGSESLDDLKKMEELGVEITSCGTCLDYYGLKDKLEVGTVTNMYSIVEDMNNATTIIRP